jgi:hypothetical protein
MKLGNAIKSSLNSNTVHVKIVSVHSVILFMLRLLWLYVHYAYVLNLFRDILISNNITCIFLKSSTRQGLLSDQYIHLSCICLNHKVNQKATWHDHSNGMVLHINVKISTTIILFRLHCLSTTLVLNAHITIII